jgi:hypothetical protein
MSNEHQTSIGAILKAMKDESLHIVRQRPSGGQNQLFTLHDEKGAPTEYGPYSIGVLQAMLDQGLIKQDQRDHDDGRPIYRLP